MPSALIFCRYLVDSTSMTIKEFHENSNFPNMQEKAPQPVEPFPFILRFQYKFRRQPITFTLASNPFHDSITLLRQSTIANVQSQVEVSFCKASKCRRPVRASVSLRSISYYAPSCAARMTCPRKSVTPYGLPCFFNLSAANQNQSS